MKYKCFLYFQLLNICRKHKDKKNKSIHRVKPNLESINQKIKATNKKIVVSWKQKKQYSFIKKQKKQKINKSKDREKKKGIWAKKPFQNFL